ncbi:MAG TPA: DUF86 domain-containing protein [Minicystis sp.]|nr:DUF86 domain-containing protein [Minicystis sp.]
MARRLLALHEALADLARAGTGDPARLAGDRVLRAAVERWLQIAIEACVDVASHAIASEGWTPPETGRAAFATLAGHGRLAPDLAARLARAVGLRNLLVHEYVAVDLDTLARVVREDLGDLAAFAAEAATWLAPTP